jgi:hypothetical protein
MSVITLHPGPSAGVAERRVRWLRSVARGAAAVARRVVAAVRELADVLTRRISIAWLRPVSPDAPGAAHEPASDRSRRLARTLSAAVALLTAASSATGLLLHNLYQDPAPLVAALRGYDLVALVVGVPLLTAALARARHGSPRAVLLWAGALAYVVYHYAVHVFGTAFNALFLVHLAAFFLSGLALVVLLRSLDVDALIAGFRSGTPVRAVGGALAALAVALGGMWTYYSVRFALTGATPGESRLVLPLSSVHLGYVLDLVLLVPSYAAAAVLLWRRRPWGVVAGTVLLVAGALSQLDYVVALLVQAASEVPGATAFDPVEPIILGVYAAGVGVLLRGLAPHEAASGTREIETEEVVR